MYKPDISEVFIPVISTPINLTRSVPPKPIIKIEGVLLNVEDHRPRQQFWHNLFSLKQLQLEAQLSYFKCSQYVNTNDKDHATALNSYQNINGAKHAQPFVNFNLP